VFGLAAGGAAYTCFLLWVNDLQLAAVKAQLEPVVTFVTGFDQTWEKKMEPVMGQLNKLSTSIGDLKADVKSAKAVGLRCWALGQPGGWPRWRAVAARRPARRPPPERGREPEPPAGLLL
jgi:hypothetical protein